MVKKQMNTRCAWANNLPADYTQYHDEEWCVPVHDDRRHFELLTLEIAQAGLNWLTVLRRRSGYRQAWARFDVAKIAAFDEATCERLSKDIRIIRNARKVHATVNNAQRFLTLQAMFGSFDQYIWQFVEGRPIINYWEHAQEIPATTTLSDQISRDLKQRGFQLIGSTVIYAYLQAAGLVNDHTVACFRHQALSTV